MSQQAPKRLPLIAPTTARSGSFNRDSRLINAYAEKTEAEEVWAVKRPGFRRYLQVGSTGSVGRGLTGWNSGIYSVFGGTFYNATIAVGSVAASGQYTFSDYLGSSPGLFFHNETQAYVSNGVTLTQVTDPDYPGNSATFSVVPGAVFIDGTMYVMDFNAFIYGSDLNDPLAWDPLNKLQAQIEGGLGVAIAKQQNYLVAFKSYSVEVFYDARNPAGSPLGRVEAAKLSLGCFIAESVQNIDGDLFWVAQSRTSQLSVAKMSGLKYTNISTPPIERLIKTYRPTDAFSVSANGHLFYCLNIGVINGLWWVLAYDIEVNFWHVWTFNEKFYNCAGSPLSESIVQQAGGGGLFLADEAYYVDQTGTGSATAGIQVDVYTPNFDAGTRMGKMLSMVEITADQVRSELSVSFSDDDYQTWSSPRTTWLDAERVKMPDWGTFTRRAFHVRHNAATALRLKAIDLHLDVCTL